MLRAGSSLHHDGLSHRLRELGDSDDFRLASLASKSRFGSVGRFDHRSYTVKTKMGCEPARTTLQFSRDHRFSEKSQIAPPPHTCTPLATPGRLRRPRRARFQGPKMHNRTLHTGANLHKCPFTYQRASEIFLISPNLGHLSTPSCCCLTHVHSRYCSSYYFCNIWWERFPP